MFLNVETSELEVHCHVDMLLKNSRDNAEFNCSLPLWEYIPTALLYKVVLDYPAELEPS